MINQTIQTHEFRAMGSHMAFWLELDGAVGAELLLEGERMFRRAEAQLTRFDASSELSCLNTRPGQWTSVSPLLWRVISQALELAEETNGLFDPTLLNALEFAGYTTSFETLAGRKTLAGRSQSRLPKGAPEGGRYQAVCLDARTRSVFLPAGTRLDLGGLGKGFMAQEVVDYLGRWGPCLVDAGGDITAGKAPAGWPGWPVGLAAPRDETGQPGKNLLRLWLKEATLATSGQDHRRWQSNGQPAHHVIDPRTGRPAEAAMATVSVLDYPAGRAEAWATASLISGNTQHHHHNLAAAFIGHNHDLTLTPQLAPLVQYEAEIRI